MRLLMTTLGLLLVAGCGLSAPTEGTVTDLRLVPAHAEQRSEDVWANHCGYGYRYTASQGGYGFAYGCDYEFDHTRHWTEYIPDCWKVTFADAEGHTNHDCVPEYEYVELHKGSHYKMEKSDG